MVRAHTVGPKPDEEVGRRHSDASGDHVVAEFVYEYECGEDAHEGEGTGLPRPQQPEGDHHTDRPNCMPFLVASLCLTGTTPAPGQTYRRRVVAEHHRIGRCGFAGRVELGVPARGATSTVASAGRCSVMSV